MVWGALIGAVGSLIAGNRAAGGASSAQHAANQQNIELQKRQQAWEQMMSNTEVQRRKADMEAAGFNPMLSHVQGQAASTPNVAPARVESTGETSSKIKAGNISTAVQAALLASQLKNVEADTTLKTSTAAQAEANIALLRTTKERVGAEYDKIRQEVKNLEVEGDLKAFDRDKLKPLQAAYQEFVNKQAAAGIPEAEAQGKFWTMLSEEGGVTGKALMFLKQLIK